MTHTVTTLELARCAEEPIGTPGAIQPHGRLLVLEASTARLVAYSANWLESERARAACDAWARDWVGAVPAEGGHGLGVYHIDGNDHEAIAHRSGPLLMVEFERASAAQGMEAPIYSLARQFLPSLQGADTLRGVTDLAAREIKRLTGFGRCLVYRFDSEGHGEVLSEVRESAYDAYVDHRFPASDVPEQARALYRRNQIRLIPDAHYVPVPLVCVDTRWQAADIDLTCTGLRSVSPVHLEYMRNMGTRASMSVSIVVAGRLWGLISCHDHAPRVLSLQCRAACEHLGRLLALQIEAKEAGEEAARRLELRRLTLDIVSHMAESDATLRRLLDHPEPLLRMMRAHGAAVVRDDQCWTVGTTPDERAILALSDWARHARSEVAHDECLAESHADARSYRHQAAGVLAISISQVHRHLILWFRPEYVRTIHWAGDPRKGVESSDGRLHPRRSFATWKEEVAGRALPWRAAEIAAALELRQALIGIVLRRAEEMAAVAGELGRVNKELEAFSYTVSHDLRAPMRHISGYVDLVLEMEGAHLSARAHRYLSHVKEASLYAGQLVDALLNFSRLGRSTLERTMVDVDTLVSDLIEETVRQEGSRRIEWQVARPLQRLWADPILLQVALRNLLGNAVKYTRKRDPARISVRSIEDGEGVGLSVADNGVGFQMKYASKLFGVFQRLHQAEEFEGTGIGLANVRRIVERHGGSVRAHGEPDRGATFAFVLPRPPGAQAC